MNSKSLCVYSQNHGNIEEQIKSYDEPSATTSTTTVTATTTASAATVTATTTASAATVTATTTTAATATVTATTTTAATATVTATATATATVTAATTNICASSANQRSLPSGSLLPNSAISSIADIENSLKDDNAVYKIERISNAVYYSEMWTTTALPTAAETFDDDKIIIVFEDRRVRILQLHFTSIDLFYGAPSVIFDFQNHPNISSVSAIQRLFICPWVSRTVQSTSYELIIYSKDASMSHWHLQMSNKTIPIHVEEWCNTRDSSSQVQVPEFIMCRGVRNLSP